jgi:Cu(I)/Ag(I) efflux system membrane fusion protein
MKHRTIVLGSIAILAGLSVTGYLIAARSGDGAGTERAKEHALKHLDPSYRSPMQLRMTSDEPGKCLICKLDLVPIASAAADEGERKILYYRNPMNPSIRSAKPMKDNMGMDYIPVYADDAGGATVSIAPQVLNNLGVRTARVERGTLARHIDTVGYVGYAESLIGHVHLRTDGWIEQLAISTVGDRVEGGQLLFTLYSPTVVNAQEEFVQALERGNERLINASEQKLAALGVSAGQVTELKKTRKVERTISVFAHHPGVVDQLNVREGMYADAATEAMTLIDLREVWLMAEVFEQQSDWVERGAMAEASVPSIPGRTWQGVVDYVYPSLDPVTRTLKVRLKFDNPGEILKPNMFAHVRILGAPRADAIHVPREAVIRDGRGERVILALGEGQFAPRGVTTGIESGERVEVLEGLSEGDTVVTSAQFLLDSEASLRGSFERMSPATAPAEQTP